MSNSWSITQLNLTVPLLSQNGGILTELLRNSIALATEELRVCPASLTFILCFSYFRWFDESVLANFSPSCS
jgi:hypothetical protein